MAIEQKRLPRREFLRTLGIATGAALLFGCQLSEKTPKSAPASKKLDLPIRPPRPDQTHPRLDDYDVENIDCTIHPEEYPVAA